MKPQVHVNKNELNAYLQTGHAVKWLVDIFEIKIPKNFVIADITVATVSQSGVNSCIRVRHMRFKSVDRIT